MESHAKQYVLHNEIQSKHPTNIPHNHTRIVTLSDTHNQHDELTKLLPFGHILVHCGDVLTESGLRHINKDGTPTKQGIELFENFAKWFGAQPHHHKVLIGGNHDMVMDKLGKKAIQEILDKYCKEGTCIYLEGETCSVGGVKIFGTPYASYPGHNNAFYKEDDFRGVEKDTHIFLTHYPLVLPSRHGGYRESAGFLKALHKSGALLHVGGHCHWAYGIYKTSERQIPSVVASNCDSKWLFSDQLTGERGDKEGDLRKGGYNVAFNPIVIDLKITPPEKHNVLIRHKIK